MSRIVAFGTSMAITLPPVVLPTLSGDGPVTELTVRRHVVSLARDLALNYCPRGTRLNARRHCDLMERTTSALRRNVNPAPGSRPISLWLCLVRLGYCEEDDSEAGPQERL